MTQWEVVATVQTISEAHLLPVIRQMLEQFPFAILGFHADNGSEYVNHRVARMLDKLKVEFTRSRPRRGNDNGLAETKNGAVVRQEFGFAHIPQRHATRFNTYCAEYLNPFLNFHRPCSAKRCRSIGSARAVMSIRPWRRRRRESSPAGRRPQAPLPAARPNDVCRRAARAA